MRLALPPRPALAGLSTWRGLGWFWLATLASLGALGVALQLLGPLPSAPVGPAPRALPGPIAGPDAALLDPVQSEPGRFLPRIGKGGRTPMAAYAAPFAGRAGPRVGLIVAGVGLDHAASEALVRDLPGGVTLAVSPYAHDLAQLLAVARERRDETLISIPMEPRGAGLDDPGDRALMTSLPAKENARRLDWALSRITGYVGATGALGRLRGEKFAAQPDLLDPVLHTLAGRGLLYVDPRPGIARPAGLAGRTVDVVVDDDAPAEAVDAQLAELGRIAREHGSALGLAGAVRPVSVARIKAWMKGLPAQGLVLAPVSALVAPPAR
ncbi:MAG: divergent polysaccharide deacetylase family protein [Acetobacteraceae bacterium]